MCEAVRPNWPPMDVLEGLWARAVEIAAVLSAIDAGELLAELPERPEAKVRHRIGVALLAVLNREVASLAAELETAAAV